MRNHIHIRQDKGQTMTEFAIVLPVLCLLLFGVIQFGIAFNNYVTLTDGVRAGARKAAVSRFDDPAGKGEAEVRSSARDLDQDELEVSVTSDTWARDDDVTVTARYPYSISLLGLVVADGWLESTTTERLE
jgi:Flp pilus assembly protein TadG